MNTLTYVELSARLNEICNNWFITVKDGELIIRTGLQFENNLSDTLVPWVRPCTATQEQLNG